MEKEVFNKYASLETPDLLSFSQAQNLLKDVANIDPETVKTDFPIDVPITFDLIQIYLAFKKSDCAGCCGCLWPILLQVLQIKLNKNNEDSEKFNLKVKAGESLKENTENMSLSLNLSLGEKKAAEETLFSGFILSLSCEDAEQVKPKIEMVLSNIKTLLKNFAKSVFKYYDLVDINVEAKQKEVLLKFMIKNPEILSLAVKVLEFIQDSHTKNNGYPIQGGMNLDFQISCEGDAKKLLIGGKLIDLTLFLRLPHTLKTIINNILYEEADKLLVQKESFAAKYISRVSYFCLLQGGNFDLEFAKAEGLCEAIWKEKQPPLGEYLEENLIDILRDGPPFVKKFIDTFSLLSGNCSLKMVTPAKNLDFVLNFHIPKLLSLFLKDLLSRKLK